jgi:hypothetical protein
MEIAAVSVDVDDASSALDSVMVMAAVSVPDAVVSAVYVITSVTWSSCAEMAAEFDEPVASESANLTFMVVLEASYVDVTVTAD